VDVSHLIETTGEFWEYPLCEPQSTAAAGRMAA